MRGPVRFFYSEKLQDIMKACIIFHNMIVEDELDVNEAVELDYEQIDDNPTIQLTWEHTKTPLSIYGNYKRSCRNLSV